MPRLALIALAAMVKNPGSYRPESDPDVPALKLKKTDFLHAEETEERRLALKIIDRVLDAMNIAKSDILEELERGEVGYVNLAPFFKDWNISPSI
jgi:hypothetical protein